MNGGCRKAKTELGLCPKCGRDSGERKATSGLPIRFFVRCASCGYIVGADTRSAATYKWNKGGRQ